MSGHSRGVRIDTDPAERGRREFYFAAVGALVADQVSKYLVRALVPNGTSVTVIPRVLEIAPQQNTGAAFGILEGAGPLLILIGLVAVFAIVKLRKERSRSRPLAISLGLLLGGATGNLIDRLAFGAVYDFLDFHLWPVFNLADVAVTIGGALLIIYWITVPREQT